MAITIDDFNKIWASTSPLTPYTFSDANYKQGWNFVGNTPPSRQMWDSWLKMTDEKCQYLYNHEDVPIGHEYFTFNPNIPQGSLPLFGGEYSRETYADLWNWVQQQAGYLKTEAEWQTLATANNGNVPFYSDGDGSTTFRVPSLKCWVKSANGTVTEVGSYLQAGLPNITGEFKIRGWVTAGGTEGSPVGNFAGALQQGANGSSSGSLGAGSNQSAYRTVSIDASQSSAIYGNANTVQPESIVGMWLVKAYGVIVDTGTIDEQQYIDDRLATKLSLTGGTMLGAIKGDSLTLTAENGGNSVSLVLDNNGSATWNNKEVERVNAIGSGYIRYESGLQICYGVELANSDGTLATFPMPFISTPTIAISNAIANQHCWISNPSTTSVTLKNGGSTAYNVYYIAVGAWK